MVIQRIQFHPHSPQCKGNKSKKVVKTFWGRLVQVNPHTVDLFVLLLGTILAKSVYKPYFGCTMRPAVQHKAENLTTHWHTLLDLQGSWRCSHIPGHAACHTGVCQCRFHPSGGHTPGSIHIHPRWEQRLQGRLTQSLDTGMALHTVDNIPKVVERKWFIKNLQSVSQCHMQTQIKLGHCLGLFIFLRQLARILEHSNSDVSRLKKKKKKPEKKRKFSFFRGNKNMLSIRNDQKLCVSSQHYTWSTTTWFILSDIYNY